LIFGPFVTLFREVLRKNKLKDFATELQDKLNHGLLDEIESSVTHDSRINLLQSELAILLEEERTNKSKISIIEKGLNIMKAEVSKAEEQLKAVTATKLDIANLAVNIQELTLNALKEFETEQNLLDNLQSKLVLVQKEISSLKNKVSLIPDNKDLLLVKNRLSELEENSREVINQVANFTTSTVQHQKSFSNTFAGFSNKLNDLSANHDLIKGEVEVLDKKFSLQKADSEKFKNSFLIKVDDLNNALNDLRSEIVQSEKKLWEVINQVRNELSNFEQNFGKEITNLNNYVNELDLKYKKETNLLKTELRRNQNVLSWLMLLLITGFVSFGIIHLYL